MSSKPLRHFQLGTLDFQLNRASGTLAQELARQLNSIVRAQSATQLDGDKSAVCMATQVSKHSMTKELHTADAGIVRQNSPRDSWLQAILKLHPPSSLDYKAHHGPQTLSFSIQIRLENTHFVGIP